MFRMFRSKNAPQRTTDAPDTRGLEVIEDDPASSWSLWQAAVAEQDSRFNGNGPGSTATAAPKRVPSFAAATVPAPLGGASTEPADPYAATVPMGLEANSCSQPKEEALEIVARHHPRVAHSIRTLWGNKECGEYINKLIMSGDDGSGHSRAGFHQEAADAMMVLADLHDLEFGMLDMSAVLGPKGR